MPDSTTFSTRFNAKRAAEKAVRAGSAPSINYGIKPTDTDRFEVVWHTSQEAEEPATEGLDDYEAPNATESQPVTDADIDRPPEEADLDRAAEGSKSTDENTDSDPFPKGARVQVHGKNRFRLGTVDYRVDANYCRVFIDGTPGGSTMHNVCDLLPSDADAPTPEPKGKPGRKPRGAPSGNRAPSKSIELDAAAARGEIPTKPIITSKANPHYQARFDKLEAWALAGDWDAVRSYEVKGINSYAKMVIAYRDRLLAAHAAQQAAKSEAA